MMIFWYLYRTVASVHQLHYIFRPEREFRHFNAESVGYGIGQRRYG
jgi:hypothetical protein